MSRSRWAVNCSRGSKTHADAQRAVEDERWGTATGAGNRVRLIADDRLEETPNRRLFVIATPIIRSLTANEGNQPNAPVLSMLCRVVTPTPNFRAPAIAWRHRA